MTDTDDVKTRLAKYGVRREMAYLIHDESKAEILDEYQVVEDNLADLLDHITAATRAPLEARIAELEAENTRLREALEWYEAKVTDCRKITREGEVARHELDRDGGERARAALQQKGQENV